MEHSNGAVKTAFDIQVDGKRAMPAASQLSGRGPTGVMLPLYLHVNQKSDYDDIMLYDNIVKTSENLNRRDLLKPASSLPALPISIQFAAIFTLGKNDAIQLFFFKPMSD